MQILFILKRNLDLCLRNDADLFLYWEKLKSTFRKDADLFLYWEKFRFASKKDADLFYLKKNSDMHLERCRFILFEEKFRSAFRKMKIRFIWRKFRSASKKDVDLYYLKKNSDLHLRRDADLFYFENKKELTTCRSLKLRNILYQQWRNQEHIFMN